MIEISHVNKWYGPTFQVLKDCTTSVAKGEVVVVCGPSGSGKSTLIKCVNALEPFQEGQIILDGIKVNDPKTDLPKLRARVGMVFQHFELFPHLRIIENLCLAQEKVLGRSHDEAMAKGAKRPTSHLRSVLMPFQPVQAQFVRSRGDDGEVRTLRNAEWGGGAVAALRGAEWFAAFYLNELLLRLLARDDPHPRLFDAYAVEVARVDANGDGVISALEGDVDSASDGFADNSRLFIPATQFNRFAVTREINDGLLAPRFAPSTRGWVLSGNVVTGFPAISASEGRDSDDR